MNTIAYRLPNIADVPARVSSATVYSKLDMPSGLYQVRKRAGDVAKTGCARDVHPVTRVTPYGNFKFKVMPTGLCGAPPAFQYLMDSVFRKPIVIAGLSIPANALVAIYLYLNDICVVSTSIEEHVLHVRPANPLARAQAVCCTIKMHMSADCDRCPGT